MNPEHYDILMKGVKVWNRWRVDNPETIPDLRWAKLQGADLQGAKLQGAKLQGAKLQGADLQGGDLQNAKLQNAKLQNAKLQNAKLQGANLQGMNLQNAKLQNADLRGADLDFSCWPLWCGSIGVKMDEKIAQQLLYHAFEAAREFVKPTKEQKDFINQFHRVIDKSVKPL